MKRAVTVYALTVRFPSSLAASARTHAGLDGMTLSAWIRNLISREIGRRDGKCPCCGQEVRHDQ